MKTDLCLLSLLLVSYIAQAADEPVTLSFIGDRIVADAALQHASADDVLNSYYQRLTVADQNRLRALQSELAALMPDYQVAFSAADTAEVNSVLSAITARWSTILDLHNKLFAPEAATQLREAYGNLYPLIAPD